MLINDIFYYVWLIITTQTNDYGYHEYTYLIVILNHSYIPNLLQLSICGAFCMSTIDSSNFSLLK